MAQQHQRETQNPSSRWHKTKSAVQDLLQQFASQCRLHAEADLQQRVCLEQDKVLCDMLVHAEFLYHYIEDLTKLQLLTPDDQQDAVTRATAAQSSADLYSSLDRHAPVSAAAMNQQEQEQRQDYLFQHMSQQQHRQQLLPNSYVAHLLRHVTLHQVKHVLDMTAQDWASWMADRFFELVIQLETWSRTEYACSDDSSVSFPAHMPDSTQQQQQQQQPCQAGRGLCGSSAAPAVTGAGVTRTTSLGKWPWQQQQQQQQDVAQQQDQQHEQAKLSWLQKVPAMSPAHARAVFMDTLEGCVQQNMLGCVLNYIPMIQAEAVLTDGGRLGHSGEDGFWEGVTDRLQLSPTQMLQLSVCMTQLRRMNDSFDGRELLQRAAEPNLQVAAAQQQEQQPCRQHQPQQQEDAAPAAGRQHQDSPCPCSGAAVATAAAVPGGLAGAASVSSVEQDRQQQQQQKPEDTCEQQDIQQSLKQFSDRRYIHLLAAQLFIVNTLSRFQLGVLGVASYPHCPGTFAVANTVVRRVQQRQEQWLQGIENSAKSTGKVPADLAADFWDASNSSLHIAEGAANGGVAGSSRQGAAVPYSQRLLQQHEQERAAQLRLHQRYCWSQLGVDLPSLDAQLQQQH